MQKYFCKRSLVLKYILRENAFSAWREAILLCDSISSGFATLKYQKQFVAALHNSVELVLKQIMLNNGDHNVAYVRNTKGIDGAQLACDYYTATDLNQYFDGLSPEDIDKFASVDFKDIIDSHKKIIGNNMPRDSFKSEMKLLQTLRNNETHFMINKTAFFREEHFVTLFNFMIDFYKVIESSGLLPFWGEPRGENKNLVFKRNQLTIFSYLDAAKNNSLTVEVAAILDGSIEYGQPSSSSYNIASDFCRNNITYENLFEKIWTILEVLGNNDMISFEEIVDELPEGLDSLNRSPHVYYIMHILK